MSAASITRWSLRRNAIERVMNATAVKCWHRPSCSSCPSRCCSRSLTAEDFAFQSFAPWISLSNSAFATRNSLGPLLDHAFPTVPSIFATHLGAFTRSNIGVCFENRPRLAALIAIERPATHDRDLFAVLTGVNQFAAPSIIAPELFRRFSRAISGCSVCNSSWATLPSALLLSNSHRFLLRRDSR